MTKAEGLVRGIRVSTKLDDMEAEAAMQEEATPEEPKHLSGALLKLSGTAFFTERWQLRWFEVRAGYLRWWDSPAEAQAGAPPKGSQELLLGSETKTRTKDSTTQFTLETYSGKDKIYVLDTNASKQALKAGWDISKIGHPPDMQAWMKIISLQKGSSVKQSSPRK
jgi:hypothetical protein